MQVVELTESNAIPLSSKYVLDNNIEFSENVFYTENNFPITINYTFNDSNDSRTNNFSNLFLTNKKDISEILKLSPLDYLPDEGFSTYLAANALTNIGATTRFMVAEEPEQNINVANMSMSGTYVNRDNRYYIEIILLDKKLCKIAHENKGVKRFLTLGTTGNLVFAKDAFLDYLGEYSPQIFGYIYDREDDFIVFYKNVNDIVNYLVYNPTLLNIQLTQALTGTSTTFRNNSIFKCVRRPDDSNTTKLLDSWVSYNKDLDNNKLEINNIRSFENPKNNILVNCEYFNISGNEITFNLLSLKNTNTPENFQARANPFLDQPEILHRDYKQLFSGSNQEGGDDTISLEFDAYTSSIFLKKDKVTYFHIPQVFYPFKRLNIKEAKLQEAGAIAGDHPLRSDKIFKKKADYKYTSNFGDSKEENSGQFLCAWLSGNTNPQSKPVWVDRYYDPTKISYLGALSSLTFNIIDYKSVFKCLTETVETIYGRQIPVFDKPSDLFFEPGTYYAYQHIGENYCNNFIRSLTGTLLQKNLINYLYTDGGDASNTLNINNPEYTFDGDNYSISTDLSKLEALSRTTLIFDMYNEDWTKPFGYQILGNYSNDGLGIFNNNLLTPTLFLNSGKNLIITNLNLDLLNTVEFSSSAAAIMRVEGLNDYYAVCVDSTFKKLNNKNVEIFSKSSGPTNDFKFYRDSDYTSEHAFILTLGKIFKASLETGNIQDISDQSVHAFKYAPGTGAALINAFTLNYYNNVIYLTPGSVSKRVGNSIYYLRNNKIFKWSDIDKVDKVDLIFNSTGTINNFSVDLDNNIWVLFKDIKFIKFDSSLVFQTSGAITNSYSKGIRLDFTNIIENGEKKQYTYITALSSGALDKIEIYKVNSLGKIVDKLGDNKKYYLETFAFKNSEFTQIDYLREFIKPLYPETCINLKCRLVNIYNEFDYENINLIYNLSSLSPGYHNFAIRLDSYKGDAYFLIDGQVVGKSEFAPRKYGFSDLTRRPFIFGTAPYTGSTPIFEYLNDNSFNAFNIKLKNIYLYSSPLNYFDICFHSKLNDEISDVIFNMPSGKKSLLEEVERYFKFRTPGSKATIINVVLKNSGIDKVDLKLEIEKRILSLLNKTLPAYLKVGSIFWKN